MSKKTFGILLVVVGVLIVLVVVLAVPLHLSAGGFGLKKIAATVIGLIAVAAGLFITLRKKS
jgi:hypothetical protein